MILAAVGKNGTGKDFFLDYVAQKYGFPMISIGDVVRELATKDGLELTRDNLHATSKKYMGEFGRPLRTTSFRAAVRPRISRFSARLSAMISSLLMLLSATMRFVIRE